MEYPNDDLTSSKSEDNLWAKMIMSDSNIMTSTHNPFQIPDIAAHLLTFVATEDLKSCRLTCSSWAELGAREIIRRIVFHFSESNLHEIATFQTLMTTAPKISIRLHIKITQFALCRHYRKMLTIFELTGDRLVALTLSFPTKEENLLMENSRLLWSIRYEIHMLKSRMPNGPGTKAIVTEADLKGLKELTNLNLGGKHESIEACNTRLFSNIHSKIKELIVRAPNLETFSLSAHDGYCCDSVLGILVDVGPVHLRHLKVESPKLVWGAIVDILKKSSSKFNFDTLCIEPASKIFSRVILSSQLGKSRIIATGPRFQQATSKEWVKKLRMSINRYQMANYIVTSSGQTRINCIGLLQVVASTLNCEI